MHANNDGLRLQVITTSSVILHSEEVREIGLRSLLISSTRLHLGIGHTFANFQTEGTRHSSKDAFSIAVTGAARRSVNLRRIQLSILLGPLDLLGLM